MIAPIGLSDDDVVDAEDGDMGAADGAIVATVTVGEDTATPGYDVCRAIVS